MKRKFKKAVAVVLTMTMAMSTGVPAFAEEHTMANATTDLVVVNGLKITNDEFELRKEYYSLIGENTTDQFILDNLVEEKAVISYAEFLGVQPSEREVVNEMKELYNILNNTSQNTIIVGDINLSLEEYFSCYEREFAYYRLCIDNLMKELYAQAEALNIDKYDYAIQKRFEWKSSAEFLNNTDVYIDLQKQFIDGKGLKKAMEEKTTVLSMKDSVQPLADLPENSFSGHQRTNIVCISGKYGILNFPVSIDIMGWEYNDSGDQWISSTDAIICRHDNYYGDPATYLTAAFFTSADGYKDGSFVRDYYSAFSAGYINDRLLSSSPIYGMHTFGTNLGAEGAYYLNCVATVIINSTSYTEIYCATNTF